MWFSRVKVARITVAKEVKVNKWQRAEGRLWFQLCWEAAF